MFKLFSVIGFVAVALAADLDIGTGGGRIIFEQNVTASPTIWKQTQNLTVHATKSDEVISRIVIIDNRPEKDGEAKVVEGGEGQKNVTIELKSPTVFRGFDFSVQIFAVPENGNAQTPVNPTSIGLDTQNPQVPIFKDINVNKTPKEDNSDEIIVGAPKPASSTTEAAKAKNDNQEEINHPGLAGQTQTRENRDTKDHKINEHKPNSPAHLSPVDVHSTKTIETKKIEQEKQDDEQKKATDSVFGNNPTQKTVDSKINEGQAPVMPQFSGQDQLDLVWSRDDEKRKLRQTEKDSDLPVLPKELKGDEKQTTPKSVLSTTEKNIETQETKNTEEHGIYNPLVVPITSEKSLTTAAAKGTTESPKLPENVQATQDLQHSLKGKAIEHHAVPLPYVNH